VSGSEGNKMAEAFRSHRITIVYERADGLFEAANSRHTREGGANSVPFSRNKTSVRQLQLEVFDVPHVGVHFHQKRR
jgi:hypothetical protein